MLTGLIHGHSGLAYLLVLASGVSLCASVANAVLGPTPGLLKVGTIVGRRVEPALMGTVGLLGLAAWFASGLPLATPYLWLGVAAFVLHGVVTGVGVKRALLAMQAGDASVRWRWPAAALANALIVLAAFGAMQAY